MSDELAVADEGATSLGASLGRSEIERMENGLVNVRGTWCSLGLSLGYLKWGSTCFFGLLTLNNCGFF